jgi:hypothetical protein
VALRIHALSPALDVSCFFILSVLHNQAFDNRTKSAREIWRQMQATRFQKANPKLKINTNVSGSAAAPQVVFTLMDDTEVWIQANRDLECVKQGFL